jgi:hypothetical protein
MSKAQQPLFLFVGLILCTSRSLVVSSSTTSEYWPTGHPECPCIDIFSGDKPLVLGSAAPDSPSSSCGLKAEDSHCFPESYGAATCTTHDIAAINPDCLVSAPGNKDWCVHQFCWVDPGNCNRDHVESLYFPDATYGGHPLAFSYETCGFVDSFRSTMYRTLRDHAAKQANGKLRIALPQDSGEYYALVGSALYPDGSKKVEDGGGVGGSGRDGAVMRFMAEIMEDYEIPWEVVEISDRSRDWGLETTGSSHDWTPCVHEVALGNADMCWANFWTTNSRRKLTLFTGPLETEPFYLIVSSGKSKGTIFDSIKRPFAPFTLGLWAAIFATLGVAGIVLAYEENLSAAAAEGNLSGFVFFKKKSHILSAAVRGCHSFNINEVPNPRLKSSASWFLQFFVGLATVVISVAYQSLVTADLMEQQQGAVSSFKEAIRQNYKFCVLSSSKDELLTRFSGDGLAIFQLVDTASSALLKGIDDGECDGALLSATYWNPKGLLGQEGEKHSTSKVRLPESILLMPISMPVRKEIAREMTFLIDERIAQGSFQKEMEDSRALFLPGMGKLYQESESVATATLMDATDLGGILLLLVFVSFLSMGLSHLTRKKLKMGVRKFEERRRSMMSPDRLKAAASAQEIVAYKERTQSYLPDDEDETEFTKREFRRIYKAQESSFRQDGEEIQLDTARDQQL